MCFWKSKQSKILVAKRNIVVYKIGESANEDTFVPYFMDRFTYKTNEQCQICPDFNNRSITVGFHGYINIIITAVSHFSFAVQKNDKYKLVITTYQAFKYPLYLGKFIIPKGATYCVNDSNEIVSDKIIYTGQYVSVRKILGVNLKEFFNSI